MKPPQTYLKGNEWQKNRYAFMSEYNKKHGIKEFGTATGGSQPYFHLLKDEDSLFNFLNEPEILQAVKKRFEDHKAGDLTRVMTNTVASQPCCFNLFVPFRINKDVAGKLFSKLLGKAVIINHIEIEFTPNTLENLKGFELSGDESLKDQGANRGTDADVAIFYSSGNNKGVILIEFKYIESEFSQCGSFKSGRDKHAGECSVSGFFDEVITGRLKRADGHLFCGYLKYENWNLTSDSKVFDSEKIKNTIGCPFRGSCQQLWRNMLLAENVARHRNLDEFHFWVLSPTENTSLWNDNGNVESQFRGMLNSKGNQAFRKLEIDSDFFKVLNSSISYDMKGWAGKFEERYLTATNN
jgi:hypothetical protein